jgi:hypothetical protein
VGYGRQPGELTFLSCSHNLESGGVPEISVGDEWVKATVLFRDTLAEAVKTGDGQYTRVAEGPDRSVLVISHSGELDYRPVSLDRHAGPVALCGYPSTTEPVTIPGRTRARQHNLHAELARPSQCGFSGGGVFNQRGELVGIWTSGSNGSGCGHYVSEFVPIFRQLGWVPANWPRLALDAELADHGQAVTRRVTSR